MIVCEYDRPHTGPCLPWEGTGQHREHIAVAADQAEWDERIAAHVALLLPHYIDGSAPGLTCGNDGEHGFDEGRMGTENEAVRACVNTPDPATPDSPEMTT